LLAACAAKTPPDHSADSAHHSFQDVEKWAPIFDAPDRDEWQRPDEVVTLLQVLEGQTVADIGTGTGYFLPHLSKVVGPNGKVLALDTEMAMVRYVNDRVQKQQLTNVEARSVEQDDPKLPLGSVDRVLIVDTWHHISGREAYAAKLKQGLADKGVVLIVEFTPETSKGPPAEMKVTAEQVKKELDAAGLQAEIVTEALPDQFVVRARRT